MDVNENLPLYKYFFSSPAGPAEVPMMSPNGSIPPIHVPPGYISQVCPPKPPRPSRVTMQMKSFMGINKTKRDCFNQTMADMATMHHERERGRERESGVKESKDFLLF